MNIEAKEYKGFEIISQDDIPDCSSKGIYLRHKKTGLEVFHLFLELLQKIQKVQLILQNILFYVDLKNFLYEILLLTLKINHLKHI